MICQKCIGEFCTGETIQGYFLVKVMEVKVSTNNSKYINFTLADRTGEVNAKVWNITEEMELAYKQGVLIKARGEIIDWQGQMQFRIDRIKPVQNEDGVNIEDFVPTAPLSAEQMFEDVLRYTARIGDIHIRNIVEYILENNAEKLLYYPAAKKNHHSIRCGLLYHITTMLKAAEKMGEVYPQLNMSLLYAGVILHDIGKVDEMDSNMLGIVSDYTVEGNLLGHIIQAIKMVENAAIETGVSKEAAVLLQHMILSHHYEPEYGSPKAPMFLEAEMLHYLDVIDSRMYDITRTLENTPQGEFSEKVWTLGNRKLFRY